MFTQLRWLSASLVATFCLLSVASSVSARSTQSSLSQAADASNDHTLTITGYGDASVPADNAMVKLIVGTPPNYGPTGPEFKPINTQDLIDITAILEDVGIAATDIITQPFGSAGQYGSGVFLGEVRFITHKPAELDRLLQVFKEAVDDKRGPVFQVAGMVFAVNDCETLEEKAMQRAIENTRVRANRLAKLAGVALGKIHQIEELGPNGSLYLGCQALDLALSTINGSYPTPGAVNSAAEVEIAVSLKMVLGIE